MEVDYWVGSTVRIEGSDVLVWSRRGDYYINPCDEHPCRSRGSNREPCCRDCSYAQAKGNDSSSSPTRSLESVPSGEAESVGYNGTENDQRTPLLLQVGTRGMPSQNPVLLTRADNVARKARLMPPILEQSRPPTPSTSLERATSNRPSQAPSCFIATSPSFPPTPPTPSQPR